MLGWLKQVVGAPLDFIKQTFGRKADTIGGNKADLKNDLHANLSELAYKSQDDAERESSKLGYKVDRSLSNPNATTFVNDRGEAIISYRGTRPTNADDLAADLHIAAGSRKHRRFDEAEDLARRVKSKYGDKVQATGHSLGGTQALHVNKKLGLNAHVFNPGATFGDTVDSDNVRVVRDKDDLISKALRVKRGSDVKLGGGGSGAAWAPLGFIQKALRAHSIF